MPACRTRTIFHSMSAWFCKTRALINDHVQGCGDDSEEPKKRRNLSPRHFPSPSNFVFTEKGYKDRLKPLSSRLSVTTKPLVWSDPPYPSDRLMERLHYRCLLRKHSHLPSQKRRPPGRAQTHFNHASPDQWSTTAPGGKETKTSFVLPVLHQRASLGGSKSSTQQIQYVPGIHGNDNTNCSPVSVLIPVPSLHNLPCCAQLYV